MKKTFPSSSSRNPGGDDSSAESACEFCSDYLCGKHAEAQLKAEFPMFLGDRDVLKSAAKAMVGDIFGPRECELVAKEEKEDMGESYWNTACATVYAALQALGKHQIAIVDRRMLPRPHDPSDTMFQTIWKQRLADIWGTKTK